MLFVYVWLKVICLLLFKWNLNKLISYKVLGGYWEYYNFEINCLNCYLLFNYIKLLYIVYINIEFFSFKFKKFDKKFDYKRLLNFIMKYVGKKYV